jgi:predicted acyl esterase
MAFVAPPADAAIESIELLDITASDGATIPALVLRPDGPGPHPVLVAPSSWSVNRLEYLLGSMRFVEAGFLVVGFTARGFWESQEVIDIAGPPTVQDFSDVVDWAIANEHGDPDRVGGFGVSYGGGISLLAAARDDRIDAVVAMSGWGSIEESFYPNETTNTDAAELLFDTADLTGKPGPILESVRDAVAADDMESVRPLFANRNPINTLDQLNANGVAVQIQQAWNDGLFSPSQMLPLYEGVTGPRKLIIAPGDHAVPELPGLLGLPNTQFDEALRWMQAHVAGEQVETGPEITFVSNDNRRVHTASSLDEMFGEPEVLRLTDQRRRWWAPRVGSLAGWSDDSWSTSIEGGVNSGADSGAVIVSGALQALGVPTLVLPNFISRRGAAVWQTDLLDDSYDLIGTPSIEITMTPSQPDTTVYAYLYEQRFGVGSLITHQPFSVRGATPGEPIDLAFDLQMTDWNVARDSRLVLVLDTTDRRYADTTTPGPVVFSSEQGSAVLTVPVRLS